MSGTPRAEIRHVCRASAPTKVPVFVDSSPNASGTDRHGSTATAASAWRRRSARRSISEPTGSRHESPSSSTGLDIRGSPESPHRHCTFLVCPRGCARAARRLKEPVSRRDARRPHQKHGFNDLGNAIAKYNDKSPADRRSGFGARTAAIVSGRRLRARFNVHDRRCESAPLYNAVARKSVPVCTRCRLRTAVQSGWTAHPTPAAEVGSFRTDGCVGSASRSRRC